MLSKFLPNDLNPFHWFMQENTSTRWQKNVVIGTVGAAMAWCIWKRYVNRNLPPGPIGWPIVGSKYYLESGTMCARYNELAKKYGDVFSVQHGTMLQIVLNSHAAINEALFVEGETFAHRPEGFELFANMIKYYDDIFSGHYHTPGWRANKTMLATCLRSAGFGKSGGIEEKMLEQIELLLPYLDKYAQSGVKFDVMQLLPKMTTNVIFQILMNKKHEYDDPKLDEFAKALDALVTLFSETNHLQNVPTWMMKTVYKKVCDDIFKATETIREVVRSELDLHQATHNPDEPRDFVDLYLTKSGGEHTKRRMVDNILTLLPDASCTMVELFAWLILYVTHYPAVQSKIAEEVVSVTGGNRYATWADRAQLSYTEATIMEITRLQPPVAVTLPHSVAKDVIFRGYRIPAGVQIFGHIFAAHRDPTVFDDPDEFRPERFLDSGGHVLTTSKWIPFGIGRRKCIGEQITKMETLLMMANIIQKYHLTFPEGENPPLKGSEGFLNTAPAYSVILTTRK